jgi:pimeloyl-ACP methyl ester carboxylesterase
VRAVATVVVRILVVLLGVTVLAACGGSDTADRGPGLASTSVATSTSVEQELLYGCIEPGTAEPLTVESAGAKLDAAVFGDGSVGIVLAHESDGSLCNWASIAPTFADDGYRVLIFDFGEPATVAQDMLAATKKIRELGAKKIVLGGASLGGTVALMTAARERNVVGAFSLSAPAVYGNAEGLPAVRRFGAPVLFAAAEEDANFAGDARRLYRASASADRELLVVPGSEHGTALYGGPAAEQVRDAVERLLERAAS